MSYFSWVSSSDSLIQFVQKFCRILGLGQVLSSCFGARNWPDKFDTYRSHDEKNFNGFWFVANESILRSKSKVFFDTIFSRYILCYYNFHVFNAKLGVSLLEWHVFVKIQVTGEIFWRYGILGPSHFRVCISFSPDHCLNLNIGSGRMIFPRDFRPKTEEVSVKTVFSYFHINQLKFWYGQDFLKHAGLYCTYRYDLEKQEGCGVVAHERLTEPRVTMEWLLAKPRSFSNLPVFYI